MAGRDRGIACGASHRAAKTKACVGTFCLEFTALRILNYIQCLIARQKEYKNQFYEKGGKQQHPLLSPNFLLMKIK